MEDLERSYKSIQELIGKTGVRSCKTSQVQDFKRLYKILYDKTRVISCNVSKAEDLTRTSRTRSCKWKILEAQISEAEKIDVKDSQHYRLVDLI